LGHPPVLQSRREARSGQRVLGLHHRRPKHRADRSARGARMKKPAKPAMRAFEYGWGGAVWKTLGQDPPVVNVTSRYGSMDFGGQKIAGFNNIELITDRPLADNLKEIYEVKKRFPKHAVV